MRPRILTMVWAGEESCANRVMHTLEAVAGCPDIARTLVVSTERLELSYPDRVGQLIVESPAWAHGARLVCDSGGNREDMIWFLRAGERPVAGALERLILAWEPGVGVMFGDCWENNIWKPVEPYDRVRLVMSPHFPAGMVVTREAIRTVGPPDSSLQSAAAADWYLRLTESFMAVHVPEPLLYTHSQPGIATTDWQRALAHAVRRRG